MEHLSFSKISTAIRCMKLYKAIYVDGIIRDYDTDATNYGKKIHSFLQKLALKITKTNDFSIDDFNKFVAGTPFESGIEYDRAVRVSEFLSNKHFSEEDIEKEIRIKFTDLGFDILGYIDIVYFDEYGTLHIIDYKTTRNILKTDDIVNDLQLNIYAMALKDMYSQFGDLNIKIGIWLWRRGYLVETDWVNTEAEILDKFKETAEKIIKGKEYPATPNEYCHLCPLVKNCIPELDLNEEYSYGVCASMEKLWRGKKEKAKEKLLAKMDKLNVDSIIDGDYEIKLNKINKTEVDMDKLDLSQFDYDTLKEICKIDLTKAKKKKIEIPVKELGYDYRITYKKISGGDKND